MADILIVDDHTGIRMLLQEVLTNEGHLVQTAKTGKEAMDFMLVSDYKILLLDFQLPVWNGAEVLRQMEEKQINIPTILMTGMSDHLPAGSKSSPLIASVVEKPFNLQDICVLVENILVHKVD